MAEKNEETRSVWDYMEHGVDFEGKETAGELLGAITADMMQAGSNLQTANRKQDELNREILERNESTMDIDEFLAAEYQNEESKEYLVEGAVLTCTNSTREIREIWDKVRGKKIKWGVGMMPSEGGPDSMKMYRKLVVTSNKGADVNGLKNATIYDCVAEENIFGFGNCVRYPDNPEEEEKLMRYQAMPWAAAAWRWAVCPQTGDGNLNAYVTNRSAENGDKLIKGVFLTAESFINGIVNDDTGLNDVLGDVARNRIVWEIKNERLIIGEQSYRTPNNWNQCEANYQKLVDRGMVAQ